MLGRLWGGYKGNTHTSQEPLPPPHATATHRSHALPYVTAHIVTHCFCLCLVLVCVFLFSLTLWGDTSKHPHIQTSKHPHTQAPKHPSTHTSTHPHIQTYIYPHIQTSHHLPASARRSHIIIHIRGLVYLVLTTDI